MFAIMLAISAAAPIPAEISAATEKIRANAKLLAPLVEHARPVMLCSIKAMATIHPDDPPGADGKEVRNRVFAKRLRAEWAKCGFDGEARFWARSVKLQFPDFSDDLARDASEESLSFFIFDTLSDASH